MKLKKKGILAGILAFSMAAAMLSGCDGKIPGIGKKEEDDYTFMDPGNGSEAPKDEQDTRSYGVSSSNDVATKIGMQVLEKGGNAVDAAIAVSFTLGVVEPFASGLGGSGGMIVYDSAKDECKYYDYRAESGSSGSYQEIGIPGFVSGMYTIWENHATMPMESLMEPAIYYAEKGYKVDPILASRVQKLSKFDIFHDEKGNFVKAGDIAAQPKLAETLRLLQKNGRDEFYKGSIAEDIVANTKLTMEDLANYQTYVYEPVKGHYYDYEIYSAAAPASGVTLIQMLEMAEKLGMDIHCDNFADYIEQMKQITAVSFLSRFKYLADSQLYDVDHEWLVSDEYIDELLSESYEASEPENNEKMETTSFSIVDADGMFVSCTNTISDSWGSKTYVDGIFLNNTNTNFSESGKNIYEPNKRSRTYTAPTILKGSNGTIMAIGSPGGSTIPMALFNVIEKMVLYGMDPQEAVTSQRYFYYGENFTLERMSDASGSNGSNGSNGSGSSVIDKSRIPGNFIWKDAGPWWGSVSLVGMKKDGSVFSTFDTRRGATMAGEHNPEEEKQK